jgi:hypothetical protein
LKERVADKYYDPIRMVWHKLRGGRSEGRAGTQLPVLTATPPAAEDASPPAPSGASDGGSPS